MLHVKDLIVLEMYSKLLPFNLLVRAECVRQRNKVAIKLGIIFLLSSRRLLNLQDSVFVGFPNFAWAPK